MSTVLGNVTATQLRYYGAKGIQSSLHLPGLESTWTNYSQGNMLDGVKRIDGMLVAAATTREMRRENAMVFNPTTLDFYQRYAKAYPSMDPRAWMPLAESYIDPGDQAAQQAYLGDRYAQFANLAYGGVGDQTYVPSSPAQRAAANRSDPTLQGILNDPGPVYTVPSLSIPGVGTVHSGEETPEEIAARASSEAADRNKTSTPGPIANALGGLVDLGKSAVDSVETVARGALTAMETPIQALDALGRTQLGSQDHQYDIARKHGLSEEETRIAFPDLATGQNPLSATLDIIRGNLDPTASVGIPLGPGDQTFGDIGALPQDRQEAIRAAQQEWAKTDESLPSIWDQTSLGQVSHNIGLLTDPDQGGTGWLPNPEIYKRVDAASGQMFDVRSDETKIRQALLASQIQEKAEHLVEKKRNDPTYLAAYELMHGPAVDPGTALAAKQYLDASDNARAAILSQATDAAAQVTAPVGWTPGRGYASIWMDTDAAEFSTASGTVDFFNSLLADPINLVPAGAATKLTKLVPGTLSHALRDSDTLLMRVPTQQFGGGGVGVATTRARSLPEALDELKNSNAKVVNSYGIKTDANGKVLTPHRLIAIPENLHGFLTGSAKGQRAVAELAKMDSATDIWLRSNGKWSFDMAQKLARSNNPDAVIAALADSSTELSNGLGRIGNAGSVALFKGKSLEDLGRLPGLSWLTGGTYDDSAFRRIFRETPRPVGISWKDKDTAARQLYKWGNGAGLKRDELVPLIDAVGDASSRIEMYRAMHSFMDAAGKHLTSLRGMDEDGVRGLTKMFNDLSEDGSSNWFLSDLTPVPGKKSVYGQVDGKGVPVLMNEALDSEILLPDYRAVRQAAGMIGAFRASVPGLTRSGFTRTEAGKLVRTKDAYLEDAMTTATSIWKYTTLIRSAYVIRNFGEMTFSASLAGARGLMTHPGAFLSGLYAATIAHEAQTAAGRMAQALIAAPGATWAKAIRENGEFAAAFAALHPHSDLNQLRVTGGKFFPKPENEGDVIDGLTGALSSFNGNLALVDDSLAAKMLVDQAVVGRNDIPKRLEYTKAFTDRLYSAHLDATVRDILDPTLTKRQVLKRFREHNKDQRATMSPHLFANGTLDEDRKFIDGMAENLRLYHQGDPTIMEAIRTGQHNGEKIIDSEDFQKYLATRMDERDGVFLNNAPAALHYLDQTRPDSFPRARAAATAFFRGAGEIDDITARIPLLRDTYLKRVEELAPHMTASERSAAIADLRARGDLKQARVIARTKRIPGGTLTREHVDMSATGAAVKEAERVFYDAHRRQNWALAARIAVPFAQSWANTFKRWGKLSMQNPQMAYRAVKPLIALQQPGSGVLYDVIGGAIGDEGMQSYYSPTRPDLSVDGFFYTNRYGDREFVYPGVGKIAQMLPFVNAPDGTEFKSQMGGLNVAGEYLSPGFGPGLTLPASMMFNTQQYKDNWMGTLINAWWPFGLPDGTPTEKVIQSLLPTIGQKLIRALDPEANATVTAQTLGTLATSGQYDLTNPSERTKAIADAQGIATRVSIFAALFGSATPSTIQPEMLQAVKDGADPRAWIMQSKLAEEYRNYTQNSESYDQGLQNFIEDFGGTALFSVLPASDTSGVQATNDIWAWRTDHDDSYQANKDVVGMFFAGGDDTGDPSTAFAEHLYDWQRSTGEINKKTLEDQAKTYSDQIAWMLWNAATSKIADDPGLSKAQVAQARYNTRAELMQKYPGWSPVASQDVTNKRIAGIARVLAEGDEGMEDTPGYAYVKAYMDERQKMIDLAQARGTSGSLTTKANQDLAQRLVTVGVALMRSDQTHSFTNAWTRVFSQELNVDDALEN